MREERQAYFAGRSTRHAAVPQAGWRRVRDAATTGLGPHEHGPAYEVCLIVGGEVEWWVGRETHAVGPGQVYVTRPGEVHGGVGEVIQPAELYWCGLSLPGPRGALGLPRNEAQRLADRFGRMQRRVFASSPALRGAFARLLAGMADDDEVLSRWRVRAAVLDLAAETTACHDAGVAAQPPPSREVRQVMEWIAGHLDEDLPIEDLADRAGLAVSRFHERFVEETGYSPGDWRNRRRIAEAKRWLRTTDRPITEIAMTCGFSTSQYFATAFKRHAGVSPSAYRKAGPDTAES
ncbi:MAG: AraC family transcriptional regulator [Planctomycetota bacterium]